jgi:hypothetical protein
MSDQVKPRIPVFDQDRPWRGARATRQGPRLGDRRTSLWCAWLAWSRFRVVIPVLDETVPAIAACLDATFRALGGVPIYCLTDNEKTVTTAHIATSGRHRAARPRRDRHPRGPRTPGEHHRGDPQFTVTRPSAAGFVTVYPGSGAVPTICNLNFNPGETVPNLVIVAVSGGKVSFRNGSLGTVHIIADFFGAHTSFVRGIGRNRGCPRFLPVSLSVVQVRVRGYCGGGKTCRVKVWLT